MRGEALIPFAKETWTSQSSPLPIVNPSLAQRKEPKGQDLVKYVHESAVWGNQIYTTLCTALIMGATNVQR